MNRSNPFASTNFFKPAAELLGRSRSTSPAKTHRKSLSIDGSDNESGRLVVPDMDGLSSRQSELTPRSIPLISLSRTPSPNPMPKSTALSEDEDESDFGTISQSRPLVAKDNDSGGRERTKLFTRGGLGNFLFGTSVGWQVYVGLLVFWVGGCQFGLLLMNRFILWTGTYKFPYPLTLTLVQLAFTHVFVLGFASLTRGLGAFFKMLGLGAVVAPSQAYTRSSRSMRYRGGQKHKSIWQNISTWFTHGSGGIAGGGLFEFQWKSAKHVLPVAVVFVAKVVLSNLSYAYAVLPMYMLARIAIIPLTLILSAILLRSTHSVSTLSSSLIAVLNLLMAILTPGRVTWESIVSGVFSSLFVALYPITLLRAYRQLVSDLVPQGDLIGAQFDDSAAVNIGTKEETRAYWRILHYTSILSMALLLPTVLASGEIKQLMRNCYFLDVPWFWFLMLCGGLGSWAVFTSTLLLIKATSPLTATFVSIPRSAFQLVVLNKFRMPAHSWVGIGLCWASCVWYLLVRRWEGWGKERTRLEGR